MDRERSGVGRLARGALLSLAAHAAVLAALFAIPRPAARPAGAPEPLSVEVAIRSLPPPRLKRAARPVRRGTARGVPARRPASAAAPGRGAALPAPEAPVPAAPRWSDAWRRDEGLALPAPRGLETTLQRDPLGGAPALEELPRAEAAGPEPADVARRRVQGRIDAFVEHHKARERVELPDVYWRDARKQLEDGFSVTWDVVESGPARPLGHGAAGALAEQWRRDARGYGKEGNPFAAGGPGAARSSQAEATAQGRGLPPDALAQAEMLQRQLGGSAMPSRLSARVLIEQREDGSVADVSLAVSSGNAAYDRLVLGQARRIAAAEMEKLGPPPRDGRKTLWAFDTDFQAVPPLPIAGCALDAYFIPRDCFYPGKKSTRSRVRLEAIY